MKTVCECGKSLENKAVNFNAENCLTEINVILTCTDEACEKQYNAVYSSDMPTQCDDCCDELELSTNPDNFEWKAGELVVHSTCRDCYEYHLFEDWEITKITPTTK